MVNEQHTRLLEQILALTDTACQASLELLDQYTGGHPAEAAGLLEDLEAAAAAVRTAQEPLLPQLEHAYTSEMLENTADALERIGSAIRSGTNPIPRLCSISGSKRSDVATSMSSSISIPLSIKKFRYSS